MAGQAVAVTKADLDRMGETLSRQFREETGKLREEFREELRGETGKLAEGIHKNGALLETLGDVIRAENEGRVNATEMLTRQLTDMEDRLGRRIELLESAVRGHSSEIRDLRAEVADLRARFDRRELDALEHRVAILEKAIAGR